MKYLLIGLALALVSFTGCESLPVAHDSTQTIIASADTTQAVVAPAVSTARIPLYWENTTAPHPERKPWTDAIHKNTDKYFANYSSAKDVTRFCPKFKTLTYDQKKKAIGEFLVALFYYESGFNPLSSSVDVGNAKDRNSYSDGLGQMSGNDGAAKAFNCDYKCLLTPVPNINVTMYQFNTQIKNTGLFILPNSSKYRYWAIILDGNKYNQIPKVIERVLKYAPACK